MADNITRVFPMLYKKTNTGAIQTWSVATESNTIITRFGQQDGRIQETKDVVTEGTNIGKRNARNPVEQSQFEAQSKWNKKVDSGYVQKIDDAEEGKIDTKRVLGSIAPMLAQDYDKHAHKI